MAEKIQDVTVRLTLDTKQVKTEESKSKKLFDDTNAALSKQKRLIIEVRKDLKFLIEARNRANNPKKVKLLNAEIRNTQLRLKEVVLQNTKTDKGFGKLNSSIKRVGITLLAAFSIAALTRFSKELFETALKMEAFKKRAEVVFGAASDFVKDFAEQNAISLGFTKSEFLGAAAAIGDIIVPLGFAREEAAKMSVESLKLSAALKEFSGDSRSVADISQLVANAFTGELLSLKSLGIAINQNDKEFKELVRTKAEDKDVTEVQARSLAIYETIMRLSTDALKSFQTNEDSLIRTTAQMTAEIRDTKEAMSQTLLPVFKTAVLLLNDFIQSAKVTADIVKTLAEEMFNFKFGVQGVNNSFKDLAKQVLTFTTQEQFEEKLKRFNDLLFQMREKLDESDPSIRNIEKAITIVTLAFNRWRGQTEEGITTLTSLNNQLKALQKRFVDIEVNTPEFFKLKNEIEDLQKFIKLLTSAAKEQEKTFTELEQIVNDLIATEEKYEKVIDDITNAILKQNAVIRDQASAEFENLNAIIERSKTEIELENKAHEERLEAAGIAGIERDKLTKFQLDALEQLEKEHQKNLTQINAEGNQARLLLIGESLSIFKNIQQAQTNIRIQSLENQNLADEEFQQRRKQILREDAQTKKALALFDIAINTAVAVSKVLDKPALIALAVALGATQAAVVASMPIPQLAKGIIDIQGGEIGKDSIPSILMPGESVMTTKETKDYKPLFEAIRKDELNEYLKTDYIPQMQLSDPNVSSEVMYDDYRMYRATRANQTVNVRNMQELARYIGREMQSQNYNATHHG